MESNPTISETDPRIDMMAPVFRWSQVLNANLQVNSVDLSNDGKYLVAATSDEQGATANFTFYCYTNDANNKAQCLWEVPLKESKKGQGFYWVAISGNGKHAVGGGKLSDGSGFIETYNVQNKGVSEGSFSTRADARVNEVSMSDDGSSFIVVAGDTVLLFQFNETTAKYGPPMTQYLDGAYTGSISSDGKWAAAGGSKYSYGDSVTGTVALYQIEQGKLTYAGGYDCNTKVLRTVITADGQYVAATTVNSEVYLFKGVKKGILQLLWKYKMTSNTVGVTYGLAITKTSNNEVFVGAGSNLEDTTNEGIVYMLQNIPGQAGPNLIWSKELTYSPNPGMNFDQEATLLTATDGKPLRGTSETPGNFYLFSAQNQGKLVWNHNTPIMNWPLNINPSGTACFGGSDDGSIYYWSS